MIVCIPKTTLLKYHGENLLIGRTLTRINKAIIALYNTKQALYQELLTLRETVEHYKPLDEFLPDEVSFPNVNILLFGIVGAGKSSVVNTWTSVFRRKIFNVARSGGSDHVLTQKFSRYPFSSGCTGRGRPTTLKFCAWDTRGLDDYYLMSHNNMRYMLQGNVPHNYRLQPSENMAANTPGFNRQPKLDERIHCTAIVLDASIIDALDGPCVEVKSNIKEMQTLMNKLDVPQVIILNKIDFISKETRDDVSKVFHSTKINDCVYKTSKLFGVPRNQIFPMKNYESETETEACVDVLALLTLKGILNQCDAYLYNQLDDINRFYRGQ